MERTRNPWEFRAIRLARWLTPNLERNLAVEARLLLHGISPGAILCSGKIQLTLEPGSTVKTDLRVNRLGLCINEGMTAEDLTTVLTVRKGGALNLKGASIGRGSSVRVGPNARLSIGSGTYFNDGARIQAAQDISVGERCAIAWNVTLLDDDEHGFGPPPYRAPILIEDDVWIGCNVIVLKGVTVGRGSVIAAGSVVTRSCPANSLSGGSPAKVLRAGINWTDSGREEREP